MADLSKRTSYHPKFYRVCFHTVRGLMTVDCRSLDSARKVQKRESAPGWDKPYILACWEVDGQYALDTEYVR